MTSPKTRKIAYVTGTRAEFGIVSPLLRAIVRHPHLKLQLYATGMHVSKAHGYSFAIVRREFPTVTQLPAKQLSDSQSDLLAFGAQLLSQCTAAFAVNRPDLVLVHGDRMEMLMVAIAASYLRIPIVHTQGGDLSRTIDDTIRHSISKLAHLHFPATAAAQRVLLQLGEEKWRSKVVGTLALDSILHKPLLTKKETLTFLKFPTDSEFFLVLLHPISEAIGKSRQQAQQVLRAVLSYKLSTVLMYPNADPGSTTIISEIEKQRRNKNVRIFRNLDYPTFLALEKHAAVWIGNSSAGIVDSPSFKTPVVNVGLRQAGRLRSPNILDVDYDQKQIQAAINTCVSDQQFRRHLQRIKSPWGDGHSSEKITKVLASIQLNEKLSNKESPS